MEMNDRDRAILWARETLRKDFVVFDTETTGLSPTNGDEAVSLGLVSKSGEVLEECDSCGDDTLGVNEIGLCPTCLDEMYENGYVCHACEQIVARNEAGEWACRCEELCSACGDEVDGLLEAGLCPACYTLEVAGDEEDLADVARDEDAPSGLAVEIGGEWRIFDENEAA